MKVAIVHHWFVSQGGGERVAEVLGRMFPDADLFTLVTRPGQVPPGLATRSLTTSFLQRIPGAARLHRHFLALYPLAVEQLDLTSYDLVITSDSGPMKGVLTHQNSVHICYCHSPARYLWDGYHSYLRSMPRMARAPFALAAHYVRNWDYGAAQRVTHFIANSSYVASRIQRFYGRESTVIHPPVDVRRGFTTDMAGDHYLAAGRLVGYKKTELLIEACQRLGRRLRIVGIGPDLGKLRRHAGENVEFTGYLSNEALWKEYARCRALLFAAEEDFGIVPVEAQACGRPVIAFGKGGSRETVVAKRSDSGGPCTGMFFAEQTVESVMGAILRFEAEQSSFSPAAIRQHAQQFSTERFVAQMTSFLTQLVPETRGIIPRRAAHMVAELLQEEAAA